MAATGFTKSTPLWAQILIGLAVGIGIGLLLPGFGKELSPISALFMKAIKMIVIPLIFSAVTLGIYKMGANMKELGRLGLMAFVWFYIATGIAIVVGIGVNGVFHPGLGLSLSATGSVPHDIAKTVDWSKFFLSIIPENALAAMAGQKILPTLFFAICFGLSLAHAGKTCEPVVRCLEGVMAAMFKLTEGVIAAAPLAVAAVIAWALGSKGIALLIAMAKLVLTVYVGLIVISCIFCVIIRLIGLNPFTVIKALASPLLLAFTTASSEVTLPVLMKILEESGIPNRIVSFVIPLGYSFNLDGAALYQSLAVCFLAEAYGLHLSLPSLLAILVTTLIANKGTANVPGASLVVLAVLVTSIGLPVGAIAIIAGVDYFSSMGRTAINVFGNTVAALALNKWGAKDPSGYSPPVFHA